MIDESGVACIMDSARQLRGISCAELARRIGVDGKISDACPQYGNMHDGLSSLAIGWNMHREDRTFSKTAFNGYRCVVKRGRVLGYRQPETGPSAFF